jgi:hypothetical protein
MFQSNKIKFVLSLLVLGSLSCNLLGRAVDRAIDDTTENIESTIESVIEESEPIFEEIESTLEAGIDESNLELESLQETTEALIPPVELNKDEIDTEFPLPDDASSFIQVGDLLTYQSSMSIEDIVEFYRSAFGERNFTEQESATVISNTAAYLIFDGHESGKVIVIQLVNITGDLTMVSIFYEDI